MLLTEVEELHGELRACVQAARRGDAEALDRVLRAIQPALQQYVERHMPIHARRWTTPADIVQIAMMENAARVGSLPSDADESELLRWMFRTARSRWMDFQRKHVVERGESTLTRSVVDPPLESPSRGSVTRADDRRWLLELIRKLHPPDDEIVRLFALEGLSFVDVATRMGMNSDAVRKRYETVRRGLQSRFSAPLE